MKKSLTIAIGGTDGAGKYTTSIYLAEFLGSVFNKPAEVISFPQHGTMQGELVDQFLYKGLRFGGEEFQQAVREGLLYSIDRMITMTKQQENGKTKVDEIKNGEKIIIFDRYLESNFIHRCKSMSNEDLKEYIDVMEFVEFNVMGLPRPDLTIILKVDPEIAYQNIINRGREMDENETLENIKASYNRIEELSQIKGYMITDCCKTVKTENNEAIRVMKTTEEIIDDIVKHLVVLKNK